MFTYFLSTTMGHVCLCLLVVIAHIHQSVAHSTRTAMSARTLVSALCKYSLCTVCLCAVLPIIITSPHYPPHRHSNTHARTHIHTLWVRKVHKRTCVTPEVARPAAVRSASVRDMKAALTVPHTYCIACYIQDII